MIAFKSVSMFTYGLRLSIDVILHLAQCLASCLHETCVVTCVDAHVHQVQRGRRVSCVSAVHPTWQLRWGHQAGVLAGMSSTGLAEERVVMVQRLGKPRQQQAGRAPSSATMENNSLF